MTGKIVFEDWSFFNAAVDRRAAQAGAPAGAAPIPYPRPVSPRSPVPPAPAAATPLPVQAGTPRFWRLPLLITGIVFLAALVGLLHGTAWWAGVSPRPALPPLPSALTPGGSTDAVVTNYVLFHNVPFRGGEVVTGWNFLRSGDPAPNGQYCYFIRPRARDGSVLPDGSRVSRPLLGPPPGAPGRRDDSEQIRYDIARGPGAAPLPLPDSLASDLGQAGWTEAASKCAWYGG
jgi:hypothetical protein